MQHTKHGNWPLLAFTACLSIAAATTLRRKLPSDSLSRSAVITAGAVAHGHLHRVQNPAALRQPAAKASDKVQLAAGQRGRRVVVLGGRLNQSQSYIHRTVLNFTSEYRNLRESSDHSGPHSVFACFRHRCHSSQGLVAARRLKSTEPSSCHQCGGRPVLAPVVPPGLATAAASQSFQCSCWLLGNRFHRLIDACMY